MHDLTRGNLGLAVDVAVAVGGVALRIQWPGTIDDVAWFLETQAC